MKHHIERFQHIYLVWFDMSSTANYTESVLLWKLLIEYATLFNKIDYAWLRVNRERLSTHFTCSMSLVINVTRVQLYVYPRQCWCFSSHATGWQEIGGRSGVKRGQGLVEVHDHYSCVPRDDKPGGPPSLTSRPRRVSRIVLTATGRRDDGTIRSAKASRVWCGGHS